MTEKDVTRSRKKVSRGYRITRFVQAIAWPTVAIIIVLVLYRDNAPKEEVELDGRTIKISFYLQQAAERGGPEGSALQTAPDITAIVRTAQRANLVSLATATVLWVDDKPDNNRNEREALAQLGLQFVIAATASDAMQQLKSKRFNAVITGVNLGDDAQGGYTLLSEVKKVAPLLPVIIYTAGVSWEKEADAKRRGAFDATDSPVRLFDLVVGAIKGRK